MTTGQLQSPGPHAHARHGGRSTQLISKVPEVTVYFWIIKVLTTGMGEVTSDFLAKSMDPIIAVGIGGVVFVAALALQFAVRRYQAWVYWTAVVMVSVFGTMVADALHVVVGIPYLVSTPFFLVALAVILYTWWASEKTLSIHSIHTRRREVFYWATVLATFALGTAAGDLTASTFGLGYFTSGVLFALVITVPAIGHWKFGLGAIPAFWFAYIITRPVGASFADWMGVSHARSGLGWGTGYVALILTVLILALVAFMSITRKDVETSV